MRIRLAVACIVLGTVVGGCCACRRSPAGGANPETATQAPPTDAVPAAADAAPAEAPSVPAVAGSNSQDHDEFCRPERFEGFASEFPCTFDSDCVPCECHPVNRAEHARLGGDA
jgi:hypothetical protein